MLDSLHIKLNKREAILTAALVLSPFTQLRIWRIGPSELFFLWFIADSLYKSKGDLGVNGRGLTQYYLLFIVLSVMGWFYNILSATNSGRKGSAQFNFAAYILTLLCMMAVENSLTDDDDIRAEMILSCLFWSLSIIDCFLFAYSRIRPTLFGMRLLYYGRFCPLADNVHQFAMIATPLPFLGMSLLNYYKENHIKIICIGLCLADVIMARRVGATKADMGITLGFAVYIVTVTLFHSNLSERKRLQVYLLLLSFMGLLSTLLSNEIIEYALRFFKENDNHSARSTLYTNSFNTILQHPIFGLGPASHAIDSVGSYRDAHETYLTAGLSAGIFGMVTIICLMLKAVKMSAVYPPYLAVMVPVLIYSGGGDVLRKMGIWVFIILVSYGAQERAYDNRMINLRSTG